MEMVLKDLIKAEQAEWRKRSAPLIDEWYQIIKYVHMHCVKMENGTICKPD
jgi:hypothetical protein